MTASGRLRTLTPAVGLLVAVPLPWLANAYIVSIATTGLIMALLAISAQIVGTTGQAALGQAGYLGVGAYTAALLAGTSAGYGMVQLAAAALTGAAAAALTGLVAVRARGVTFLMITFACGELIHVAALAAVPVTGGSDGILVPARPPLPGTATLAADGWVFLYVLAVTGLVCAAIWGWRRSRWDLRLRAIADHERRLRASGHPTGRYLWTAYTLAGAIAGIAGALLVTATHHVSPADLGFAVSVVALAAAILGIGTMPGAVLAALVLVAARDWVGGYTGHGVAILGALLIVAAALPRDRLLSWRIR
ncbi:branched-chain amino acid transport system permease protein [Hamadaea flava]|uniref:Branched-chain amino acid ABC transporter permease n=1 Tax=Hamadaea flava TaxID=1742688 RepID=A0ABV8LKH0_9ACTN|nr:branched-chain amino acid ABC transporter permease [Hamadaea flava]MCP2323563.1 branched-chain amino acid transport system permease protein [Hamadaea flava]